MLCTAPKEVNFAQSTLVDGIIDMRPVCLLIVAGVMLDVGDDALVLDSPDDIRGHLAYQERILAITFERATVLRYSRNINRGSFDETIG